MYRPDNTAEKCVTPFDGDVYLEDLFFNKESHYVELVREFRFTLFLFSFAIYQYKYLHHGYGTAQ
jgi:hypothetical protein